MANRGSRPGERRGGRQKGTPNKATADVRERLAQLGCDPIEGMARIAMDPAAPIELRGRMCAELAGYVAPKRKAVEHSAEQRTGTAFVIYGERECASAEEWQARYAPQSRA